MGQSPKVFPDLSQNWLKLKKKKKKKENWVTMLKFGEKINPIGIRMGHFLMQNW